MKVLLATQLVSHSVAAGIFMYGNLEVLSNDSFYTTEFIERADQLFDVFNSGRKIYKLKPHRAAIRRTSVHIPFLLDCFQWINRWTVVGSRVPLPFIDGWRQTIAATLMLWNSLHRDHGFHYLLTNRFNQDCLENLFGVIRQSGLCRDNPTPEQFGSAIRHALINILLKSSENWNCISRSDDLIATLKTLTLCKRLAIATISDATFLNQVARLFCQLQHRHRHVHNHYLHWRSQMCWLILERKIRCII